MFKKTILVIDDEKDILNLVEYNLKSDGYGVLLAKNGEEGYEIARRHKPDLVVLDLMLPGMDGLEVCKLLRQNEATRGIPILMLTAKSSDVDQIVGLELGAADYIAKPFSVKVLLARIKNIFRTSKAESRKNAVLRVGELELDREKMLCRSGQKTLEFTKLEFNILACLMENPGKVFSREVLLNQAWGGEAFVVDRTVDVHMRSIRKKLGKLRDWIQTVRGAGYRFATELR